MRTKNVFAPRGSPEGKREHQTRIRPEIRHMVSVQHGGRRGGNDGGNGEPPQPPAYQSGVGGPSDRGPRALWLKVFEKKGPRPSGGNGFKEREACGGKRCKVGRGVFIEICAGEKKRWKHVGVG